MLQAIGLGSWAFDGMDWMVVLGASGDPKIPGFGFRYDTNERWLCRILLVCRGVFEAYCPPHYRNMSEAVELLQTENMVREAYTMKEHRALGRIVQM